MKVVLHNGDCVEVLKGYAEGSIGAIVSDPPYELSFMGKGWDGTGVAYDPVLWGHLYRVLVPGGVVKAFSATRTFHRMARAMQDAGFTGLHLEAWSYGSGFPKSLDVSKAIDKVNGETGRLLKFTGWMRTTGLTARQIDAATETNMGGHYLTAKSQPAIPTRHLWTTLRPLCGEVPAWVDELVERIEAEREVVGQSAHKPGIANKATGHYTVGGTEARRIDITAPATDAAKQWCGWGTALKPSWEPVLVGTKPA